ncbi:MAG TPA: hydroxyphenylacetyl-CoA thioesterase PaaI [Nevskiaceae bacterium]
MAGTEMGAAAQELAERVGKGMFARDAASRGLGMVLESISPGHACMTMRVRDDMLNGHGSCQGGFIFCLADSTFAFACNSRNEVTVAASCDIDFIRPGQRGELLRAEGVERAVAGRSGVYDVTVRNPEGEVVALFRGKSRRIRGEVVPASESNGAG